MAKTAGADRKIGAEPGNGVRRRLRTRGTRHYVAGVSGRPVFFPGKFIFSAAFRPRLVKESGCGKIAAHLPMKRYLLRCPCSHQVVVAAGQAGGSVRCPECGSERVVPRLGELGRLEPAAAESADAGGRGWGAAQAWVFAGVATALVGAAVAGWLRGGRAGVAPLDEPAIRAAVAATGADQIHESWLAFEQQGIARPPWDEEQRRIRQAEALGVLEGVAWFAAAAGCVVAVVALAAVRSRPRGDGSA